MNRLLVFIEMKQKKNFFLKKKKKWPTQKNLFPAPTNMHTTVLQTYNGTKTF